MTNAERIEVCIKALPYPTQIKNLDLSEDNAIRFEWRGSTYRVSNDMFVEEVDGGMLKGSDNSILMRTLFEMSKIINK